MRWRILLALLAAGLSSAAHAQLGDDRGDTGTDQDKATMSPSSVDQAAVWIAGASGGLVARDERSGSPYGNLSLTHYSGQIYVRGAVTVYRSTVQQNDAALPSTFYVGSVGAGGNWNGWVLDAFASYGRQDYGLVETAAGRRATETGGGSNYLSGGVRAGRIFRPAPRWYATPTLGMQYAETKSLRHRIDLPSGRPEDFELPERALTFNASVRVDRTIGRDEQNFIGLSLAHYASDNGLTSWRLGGQLPALSPVTDPTPDSWQELGVSGTWRLGDRLWLDTQAQRTFGTLAGDSTTVSLGLRFRL